MDEFTSAEQALVVARHVTQAIGADDLRRSHALSPNGMCRPSPTISSTPSPASRRRRYRDRGAGRGFHRPTHPATDATDPGRLAAPRIDQ